MGILYGGPGGTWSRSATPTHRDDEHSSSRMTSLRRADVARLTLEPC